MALAESLELVNSKPGFHQHPPPVVDGMRTDVRGIANRFYAVQKVSSFTTRYHAILQQELPSGAQNPANLEDKFHRMGKMMRCGAAGDDVERGVVERQGVGVGEAILHVSNAFGTQMLFRGDQHLL